MTAKEALAMILAQQDGEHQPAYYEKDAEHMLAEMLRHGYCFAQMVFSEGVVSAEIKSMQGVKE